MKVIWKVVQAVVSILVVFFVVVGAWQLLVGHKYSQFKSRDIIERIISPQSKANFSTQWEWTAGPKYAEPLEDGSFICKTTQYNVKTGSAFYFDVQDLEYVSPVEQSRRDLFLKIADGQFGIFMDPDLTQNLWKQVNMFQHPEGGNSALVCIDLVGFGEQFDLVLVENYWCTTWFEPRTRVLSMLSFPEAGSDLRSYLEGVPHKDIPATLRTGICEPVTTPSAG